MHKAQRKICFFSREIYEHPNLAKFCSREIWSIRHVDNGMGICTYLHRCGVDTHQINKTEWKVRYSLLHNDIDDHLQKWSHISVEKRILSLTNQNRSSNLLFGITYKLPSIVRSIK